MSRGSRASRACLRTLICFLSTSCCASHGCTYRSNSPRTAAGGFSTFGRTQDQMVSPCATLRRARPGASANAYSTVSYMTPVPTDAISTYSSESGGFFAVMEDFRAGHEPSRDERQHCAPARRCHFIPPGEACTQVLRLATKKRKAGDEPAFYFEQHPRKTAVSGIRG